MLQPFSSFYAQSGMAGCLFLPFGFGDKAHRIDRTMIASRKSISPGLLSVLREQNESLPRGEVRARHLQALSSPGSAVVVTGQQVGLFLGPLYTVYKAASVIVAARKLSEESGKP